MNAIPHPSQPTALTPPFFTDSLRQDRSKGVQHAMDDCGVQPLHASVHEGMHGNRPRWRMSLDLIEGHVAVSKCKVRADGVLYTWGQPFETLHLINFGIFKIVSLTPDGRERSADFFFDGDWLGFDGISTGRHSCTAVALDIGEVWTLRYDALMQAAAKDPSLLHHVLTAIDRKSVV